MKISSELKKNADAIKNCIKSQDIIYYNGKSGSVDYCVVYVDSVTDKNQVGLLLLSPLNNNPSHTAADCENVLNIPNIALIDDMNKAVKELLGGKTLVFFQGGKHALACDFLSYQTRAVAEPPTSVVVKGPREGFTECLKTNIGLLRRRIKVSDLTIENTTLGRYSQSAVAVCYIGSIVDHEIVKEVKRRLKLIDRFGIRASCFPRPLSRRERL